MAQPLDPGIVQDDGGAMSVPDLDSGAGGGDLGAGDTNGLGADTGVADTGVADTGDTGVVDQGGVDQGGSRADDSGAAAPGADAGQDAPGGVPASSVLSDLSAGGAPADTGATDAAHAADAAGLPGGADVGQVDDAGVAGHGVPGDTGVTADNSGNNPFLNDLSAGSAGDADPGKQQPEGTHDIPDVDPNSAEGGGFLGGLFGGSKDAVNSAEQAHDLPDDGHAGAVDPGQAGDHAGIPFLDDLASGLTGNSGPGAGVAPGAQPANAFSGLVSSFDHMINPDPGHAASVAGGDGGAGFARDLSGLTSTFDQGLSSAADHFGQPGPSSLDPGAVGGLDHPAAAAGAAGSTGQVVNPQGGHGAIFPHKFGVINDPASTEHSVSTPHPTIVDPGTSGGASEATTAQSPLPHTMPAPGAEIGNTGHYGGENPQAYISGEHGVAVPTESEAQPTHEGGEDNSHVAYLHPAQESTHVAESYEHHGA